MSPGLRAAGTLSLCLPAGPAAMRRTCPLRRFADTVHDEVSVFLIKAPDGIGVVICRRVQNILMAVHAVAKAFAVSHPQPPTARAARPHQQVS